MVLSCCKGVNVNYSRIKQKLLARVFFFSIQYFRKKINTNKTLHMKKNTSSLTRLSYNSTIHIYHEFRIYHAYLG